MSPPATPDDDKRYAHVPARNAGQRLDKFLVEHFSHYSRRKVMQVLKTGAVRVNGRAARAGQVLASGDRLELPVLHEAVQHVQEERAHAREAQHVEAQKLTELYRDEDLLVVNKPPGLAVHGGAGLIGEHTLIDELKVDILDGFGLVHRIDRDTSGVVALVKGDDLRAATTARFAADDGGIEKRYEALVRGVPEPAEGVIDLPLAPPGHRGQARVDERTGKPALTRYRTAEAFLGAARLEVEPVTGRTHQIRVHLAAIGHPLLVDPLYGGRGGDKVIDPRGIADAHVRRTPLHAARLVLPHPRTGERIEVRAPLPPDMKYVEELLRIAAGRARKAEARKAEARERAGPRAAGVTPSADAGSPPAE
jgi:23S rRNA pseudouridine955/2504/2580 synthase